MSPSAHILYTHQIRHEMAQMENHMARRKIDDANRIQQYKHARHATQNIQNLHNRNIACMQRIKRK